MAYKFLPDRYRPARAAAVGDEIYPVGGPWQRIAMILEHGDRRQFIFDNGEDFWVLGRQMIEHRRIPESLR